MNLIEQTESPYYKLILKDGSFFEVDETLIDIYQNAYPLINVHAELAKMVAWCVSNESQRKTKRGIKRFINGWLNRAKPETRMTEVSQKEYAANTTIQERVNDLSWADGL